MTNELNDWIEENLLDAKWLNPLSLEIDGEKYIWLKDREQILTSQFQLSYEEHEIELIKQNKYDYAVFKFGSKYYYSPIRKPVAQLNIFRYIGLAKSKSTVRMPYLGIHGKFELGNGSRDYQDWITKAKFLGISTLGICEKNTLAGTINFQIDCDKNGIKPIIGETVTVRSGSSYYELYLYAIDKIGWGNLLRINKNINVDNHESRSVDEKELLSRGKGLIAVIPSDHEINDVFMIKIKKAFDEVYYNFDPVVYKSPEKDAIHLQSLKTYLDKFRSQIKPVLIPHAYYLDKGDGHIKRRLNSITKTTSDYLSYDQYFKSWDEVLDQIQSLFSEDDSQRKYDLLRELIENTEHVGNLVEFKIETGKFHMPKYIMTEDDFELVGKDGTNEELFWELLLRSLVKRGLSKNNEYIERLEKEVDLIKRGGFIDYFLILWDIIKWSSNNGILTGVGRGSAGGSLVAFLLNITQMDPIKYGLIFERFLNEGRIGKSLPDIDTDFVANRRGEVKQYMSERYGFNNVCDVGSYVTFAAKAALRDLGKEMNVAEYNELNYTSGMLNESYTKMQDLFVDASSDDKKKLKKFIKDHPQLFEDMPLILNQPKTTSVHAAAVIITPNEDEDGNPMEVYDWMPVKLLDDGTLVSEWEGAILENAGFLKEDILGLKQLDKISATFDLIKKNGKTPPNFLNIQDEGIIDDPEVYEMFSNGKNQDVFQFGSIGLTGYSQDVKPKNIEDLIAIVSLYRPGPMESHAHMSFVKIREGRAEPEYDYMLQEVTESTLGLYIYQEQVMKAVQILGGFTLTEADGIRKAMGKKIKEKMDSYKVQFIDNAVNKQGCDLQEANEIWSKLESFAGYGFNKSHAAAYSIIGYMCQYLKHHHPVEFWTTSLEYAGKDLNDRINEIHSLDSHIKLMTPDINSSEYGFTPDFENSIIYWSLSTVTQIGENSLNYILEERKKNGPYYSLEEFRERVPGRMVDRRGLVNLILAGAFDSLYEGIVNNPRDRRIIIKECYEVIGEDIPDEYMIGASDHDSYWILKQRELTGIGFFNYESIIDDNDFDESLLRRYKTPKEIQYEGNVGKKVVVAGILDKLETKKTKKGDKFAKIVLDNNNEQISLLIWPEHYERMKHEIHSFENQIVLFRGNVVADKKFEKKNIVWAYEDSIIHRII